MPWLLLIIKTYIGYIRVCIRHSEGPISRPVTFWWPVCPAKLHSDKGANFESKVIRKLCNIAGIQKSRTTPYHPMGNGMVERFNRTLLNMLGTMSEKQKSDWKSHVPTLTHAYNATMHESTGFSPFFLMFGRHPRLAIDAFLGI